MKKRKLMALCTGLAVSSLAHADLLGVEDAALLAKTAEEVSVLYKQLETLNKSYTTASEQFNTTKTILTKAEAQLKTMDDLVKKNSGHYGFGHLNNTPSDLRNQQWSADSWQEALKGHAGGNPTRYQALLKAYRKKQNALETKRFEKGAGKRAAKNYEQTVAVNETASVQSEYAFNEVNGSLKRIHELSLQIEKAENTKAAVDLNSRLLTEVAYLQTQNLKAQSLINQQLAQKQALDINERSYTSELLAFDDDY